MDLEVWSSGIILDSENDSEGGGGYPPKGKRKRTFGSAGMFWNCSGGMYIYPYLLNCDAKERDIPAIRSKLLGGLSVCLSVCLSVLSVNVVTVLGTFVTVTLSPSFTLPSVLTLR